MITLSIDTVAIIADVHGNCWALDVILADIQRRGIRQIINLGDSVYGPLDPGGAAERLMRAAIPSIAGNQDRIISAPSETTRASAGYQFVLSHLTAEQLDWLRTQLPTAVIHDIFCCHGTPQSDETYLLEEVTPHGVLLRSTDAIAATLREISQQVIVCAHSHVPRIVWLPTGQVVINPGSVGLPAYDEALPYPHVMQAGSPHARYAILRSTPHGLSIEQIALPYSWDSAARAAQEHGRPDWGLWIDSGRASIAQ
jgi:predicted phosphodiesterase